MKKAAICLLALLMPIAILAQTANGVIKGKLIDSKSKEALEFVTVALMPKGSTTPINGCNTDENGGFTLTQVKAGEYTLKISFVGYLDDTRNIQMTKSGRIDLGTIRLKTDNKLLKEVVVTEQRSQMKFDIDKRVFTIDQNIAATGGSATDVLEDIPSVEVSNEGTISLRGVDKRKGFGTHIGQSGRHSSADACRKHRENRGYHQPLGKALTRGNSRNYQHRS